MGRERAIEWRRTHADAPAGNVDRLTEFVFGTDAADRLGVRNDAVRERLRAAVSRFSPVDFLLFDPTREPPPSDIPKRCARCDSGNRRGATQCSKCGAQVEYESRYEIWLDALIVSYTGDIYGIPLGARYEDVLKWIRVMRPYAPPEQAGKSEADAIAYAITHVVYTLNDYGKYSLSRNWLAPEYEYLRSHAVSMARKHDMETLGEFLDTLRAFGISEQEMLMRSAIEYLLSHQNPDGSWGGMRTDAYGRYHTTWAAIDGLREYAFQGERLRRPELIALIQECR
jgi:hypothetical protein